MIFGQFLARGGTMIVTMDPDGTIYTAVMALLSLIPQNKAIYTKVEIDVCSKEDSLKRASETIHFLFWRPGGSYIRVYYAVPKKSKPVLLASDIPVWTRSANNDGIMVVGHDGIGNPISKTVDELLKKLGAEGNSQTYRTTACWILGEPRAVNILRDARKVTKDMDDCDRRYKLFIDDPHFRR